MRQVRATVRSNQPAMDGTNLLWLHAPELALEARPGQFLMLRPGEEHDPLLRRSLSVHRLRAGGYPPSERGVALLYRAHNPETRPLARLHPGDLVDVLGPLGNGFTVGKNARRLLVVGSGLGIAPLIALAEQEVARGCDVTLLAGASTGQAHYPFQQLAPLIEVVLATSDGTLGKHRDVADLIPEYLTWADAIYACGPLSLYRALHRLTETGWQRKTVQVLLRATMPCGVGACNACTAATRRGVRLVCREGPQFELRDLLL